MKDIKYSSVLILQTVFLFFCCILIAKNASAQNKSITKENMVFLEYPDFPEGSSTWDDIGYNSTYNKVYVAVTDHHNEQMLYAYDVESKKFETLGIVTELAHLKGLRSKLTGLGSYQHQGKVHTKIVEGPKGNMFFGTDGGASREEYFMNHPRGYQGGYFMKWNPATQELVNLGKALMFDSMKDVGVDSQTGILYGISYPQVHFIVYNPKKNTRIDLGRLGSGHVPRVMFTDWWGNCYYVDWRQRLVKYDKTKKELIFARKSLPAFPNTPGYVTITGITSYAKDRADGIIYLITYGGKLVAFHPTKKGIGKVEGLGGVVDAKDLGEGIPRWRAYTPDLAMGNNGNLYYFVGSEGRYAEKGKLLFVEYNPKTNEKKILFKYSTSEVSHVSGSNTTDEEGNIYFVAFNDEHPFMIKFNPTKKLQQ